MPFVLDPENSQTYSFHWGGGTFFFKRLTQADKEKAYSESTIRGQTNWPKYQTKIVQKSVIGWDDVINSDGEAIPFNRSYLASAFPGEFIDDFMENYDLQFAESDDEAETREKNFGTSYGLGQSLE